MVLVTYFPFLLKFTLRTSADGDVGNGQLSYSDSLDQENNNVDTAGRDGRLGKPWSERETSILARPTKIGRF